MTTTFLKKNSLNWTKKAVTLIAKSEKLKMKKKSAPFLLNFFLDISFQPSERGEKTMEILKGVILL